MPQIAVINSSNQVDDAEVAFWAAVCDLQVQECARAWGVAPTPVVFYSTTNNLPAAECRIMDIVDTIDVPGALGYHTDDGGFVYGRVLAQGQDTSVTLSHECLEELVDPTSQDWWAKGDGTYVAAEVCDPVEGDSYPMSATVMGTTRGFLVSNYILPGWKDPSNRGQIQVDRLGKLRLPFTMTPGGYEVVRDKTGNEGNVFARVAVGGPGAHAKLAMKLGNPDSRLLRRLRG